MELLKCPLCPNIFDSVLLLRKHLKPRNHKGVWDMPMSCKQSRCHSTASGVSSFMRHVRLRHVDDDNSTFHIDDSSEQRRPVDHMETDEPVDPGLPPAGTPVIAATVTPVGADTVAPEPVVETVAEPFVAPVAPAIVPAGLTLQLMKEKMSREMFEMILSLRGKENVPLSLSVEFVAFVKSFTNTLIDETCSLAENHFAEQFGASDVSIASFTETLKSLLSIFDSFKSENRIRQLSENHARFVAPQSFPLGVRVDSVITSEGPVCVSRTNVAQYVPISKTLKSLLINDPLFLDMLISSYSVQCETGVYSKFQDGSKYKGHPIVAGGDKLVVHIQLYSDGLGLTNLASPSATNHNSTMFYFLVLNMPPKYYAALSNIHLVAMCNSSDLKYENGQDVLLNAIVDDLSDLETDGFEVEIPSRGTYKVLALLTQFTGDNLSMNQIFGLTESFAHDFFCSLCYCTRDEAQNLFDEKSFCLRTPELYLIDIEELKFLRPNQSNVRGVKRFCVFNRLKFFHIMENWINDCMHTCLQGIIPYVCGLVIKTLVTQKLLTVDEVNDEISKIFTRLNIDKKNKPGSIKDDGKHGISFKMSAAQLWAFMRYFPSSCSHRIPQENEYWNLIILLSEIIDIVMAPKLRDSTLLYFEYLYVSFLEKFKRLYPTASVRPKMHFLIHLPTIVRKNGPMRTFWAMNYERLNGKIKAPAHIMQNYRNPQYTLAYRRQCAVIKPSYCYKDSVIIHSSLEMQVSSFPNSIDISSYFDVSAIFVTDCVIKNGTEYKKHFFLVLEKIDRGFIFGKIEAIVFENKDDPVFLMNYYCTKQFDHHSFCYEIERLYPSVSRLGRVKDLLDFHPLDAFYKDNRLFIRLKYFLF